MKKITLGNVANEILEKLSYTSPKLSKISINKMVQGGPEHLYESHGGI